MRNLVSRVMVAAVLTAAAMAFGTVATPAVSSADCGDGQWWDPTGKVCRPLGEGPQPLNCPEGQYWNPIDNVCKPLGQA